MAEDSQLTSREREVLELLIAGFTAKEIASELSVTFYTARTHIRNVYQKAQVSSRVELMHWQTLGSVGGRCRHCGSTTNAHAAEPATE